MTGDWSDMIIKVFKYRKEYLRSSVSNRRLYSDYSGFFSFFSRFLLADYLRGDWIEFPKIQGWYFEAFFIMFSKFISGGPFPFPRQKSCHHAALFRLSSSSRRPKNRRNINFDITQNNKSSKKFKKLSILRCYLYEYIKLHQKS